MAADSLKIFDILTSLGKHIYVSEVYVHFFIYWKTRSAKAVPKHLGARLKLESRSHIKKQELFVKTQF